MNKSIICNDVGNRIIMLNLSEFYLYTEFDGDQLFLLNSTCLSYSASMNVDGDHAQLCYGEPSSAMAILALQAFCFATAWFLWIQICKIQVSSNIRIFVHQLFRCHAEKLGYCSLEFVCGLLNQHMLYIPTAFIDPDEGV